MKSKSRVSFRGTGKTTATADSRRFGYTVAVVVNLVLVWVVQNIVEWDIVPFLTEEFEQVVPITIFSLVLSAIANVVFLFKDTGRFKKAVDILTTGVTFVVVVRTYQVFPFELESAFWLRVLMILVAVAIAAAVLAQLIQLIRGPGTTSDPA